MMNRTQQTWNVDSYPDSRGNWTIHANDGTQNSEANFVAAVDGLALAEHIVKIHNDSLT